MNLSHEWVVSHLLAFDALQEVVAIMTRCTQRIHTWIFYQFWTISPYTVVPKVMSSLKFTPLHWLISSWPIIITCLQSLGNFIPAILALLWLLQGVGPFSLNALSPDRRLVFLSLWWSFTVSFFPGLCFQHLSFFLGLWVCHSLTTSE